MASDGPSPHFLSLRLGLTYQPPAIETPPRPVPTGSLISWPKNASCSRIPPRASRVSLPPRRWAMTCFWLSLHPIETHTCSPILHRRRRISPRRPMYLLIVGSDYSVMRFAYALHMHRQNLVLLSCVYTELFELVIEIKSSSTTAPRLPATKLICSNVHSGAAALSASMMLRAAY